MKKPTKKPATKRHADRTIPATPAARAAPRTPPSYRQIADQSLCNLIRAYGKARLDAHQAQKIGAIDRASESAWFSIATAIDALAEERAAGAAERRAAFSDGLNRRALAALDADKATP